MSVSNMDNIPPILAPPVIARMHSGVMRFLPLILIFAGVGVFMLRPSGLYDSMTLRRAFRAYRDAPSEATRRALEEAKHRESVEIYVNSAVSVVIVATGLWLGVRSRKAIYAA